MSQTHESFLCAGSNRRSEHGALHQLILGQKVHNGGHQTKYTPSAPFAWKLLLDLVTAGILMERGDLQGEGPSGWSLLVHRDIKPQNSELNPFLGSYES